MFFNLLYLLFKLNIFYLNNNFMKPKNKDSKNKEVNQEAVARMVSIIFLYY
jgi:hypothetical protein